MKAVECSDGMSLALVLCAVAILVFAVDVRLSGTTVWGVACGEECCVAVEVGWMWMEVINHVRVGCVKSGVGVEWCWSGVRESESMAMNAEC